MKILKQIRRLTKESKKKITMLMDEPYYEVRIPVDSKRYELNKKYIGKLLTNDDSIIRLVYEEFDLTEIEKRLGLPLFFDVGKDRMPIDNEMLEIVATKYYIGEKILNYETSECAFVLIPSNPYCGEEIWDYEEISVYIPKVVKKLIELGFVEIAEVERGS